MVAVAALLGVCVGCSENEKAPSGAANEGPFKSLEVAANAPSAFSSPRAGVPLSDGGIVFIATLEEGLLPADREIGERIAILRRETPTSEVEVLYSGELLLNPLDIAISVDEKTLYIADPAGGSEGGGAVFTLPIAGGEPAEALSGYAPRAVSVSESDAVYFSGKAPDTGEVGVFSLAAGAATPLFVGAPLVDPSGIAVQRDGSVLVADTRAFDADPALSNEASIVRIAGGRATTLASGFATGYPAGIALTRDESTLIVSGEGPESQRHGVLGRHERPQRRTASRHRQLFELSPTRRRA
ncbi:MAG: hypothetical protein QM756_34085 [Polyangiaceae bacterium]